MRSVVAILAVAMAVQGGEPAPTPALQSSRRASQNPGLWRDVLMLGRAASAEDGQVAANRYRTVALDQQILDNLLAGTAREFTEAARLSEVLLEVPWPDGGTRLFRIEESPIMAPELAAQFPEIRTYRGQGIDDPAASLRFDWTEAGLHASVLSTEGTVYVDPFASGDTQNYISYFRRDYQRIGQALQCGVTGQQIASVTDRANPGVSQVTNGTQLRTYRLALAATAEYTATKGGTVQGAMSGIVTTMNRVNGVYERDLAVRMTLVGNNSSIVYTNSATDPYTNGNDSAMMCENARNLDTTIGIANYDIGHVFGTGTSGIASFGVVCNSSNACGSPAGSAKARGVTGLDAPVGDAFDIDFVAHEMGHQFGAEHTFNGTTNSCSGGNRNAATAYEPGSGSTVMGYAGICGGENLQSHSDAYFHASSQSEIISFVTNASTGGSCAAPTATGNTPPTVSAGANYTIPRSTPFTLTAVGSDANGDSLTYAWEQFNLGTAAPPNTDDGTRPIFRSFSPSSSPSRTFPKLGDILNNTSTFGESLPTTTRAMTFRVTVRDNRSGGGGTSSADMTVNVRSDMGPFVVTQPNTAVSWSANSAQTVLWNVANTTAAPVSTTNVRILLSTDGGSSFPTVLAASTPNDGTESVVMPNISPTSVARIKVEAVGNIFFDISNANFSITAARPPLMTLDGNNSGDAFIYKSDAGAWSRQTSQAGGGFAGSYGAWAMGLGLLPAQFNSDGLTDLFIFNPTTGDWLKMLNDGTGFTIQASGVWWPGWQRLVMDLDGDGISDLFLYDPASGQWFKCISTPTGFTYYQGGWSPDWELTPLRLDGDGRDDLFLINRTSGQWVWVLSESGAGFTYPLWGAWSLGWKLYPGDFSGDGLSDLLLHNPNTGQYYVATNTGAGFSYTFGSWSLGWTPFVVDLDANNVADLFLYSTSSQWYELLSDGFGHFSGVGFGSWSAGWEIYPTDFNADGRTDVLLYNPSNGQYFQASNLNLGSFAYFSGGWNTGLTIIVGKPVR